MDASGTLYLKFFVRASNYAHHSRDQKKYINDLELKCKNLQEQLDQMNKRYNDAINHRPEESLNETNQIDCSSEEEESLRTSPEPVVIDSSSSVKQSFNRDEESDCEPGEEIENLNHEIKKAIQGSDGEERKSLEFEVRQSAEAFPVQSSPEPKSKMLIPVSPDEGPDFEAPDDQLSHIYKKMLTDVDHL